MKPRSYILNDKVWLNNKYIKTKRNQKFKVKFFEFFHILYLVRKQVYKLELLKGWKIHDVFSMSMLEQDTTMKEPMDETIAKLYLDKGNNKEYKVETIWDSTVYAKKSKVGGHLLGFYYLVLWRDYPEKKNTWKPALAIQHLWRLVIRFHKKHLKTEMTILSLINTTSLMAKPIIRLEDSNIKSKCGRLAYATGTNKYAEKSWGFYFYLVFNFIFVVVKMFTPSHLTSIGCSFSDSNF